jgi:tetratricopeptide (TPR) repeat protein
MNRFGIRTLVAAAAVFGSVTVVAADQDSLSAARDLYAAAAYEEALAALNRLHPADQPVVEARAIEQYRAMCLLALGRGVEAERAIQAVIERDPSYHPADVSPRIRTAFSDVRRRVLPGIVQQRYADAKSAYDRKEYGAAASGFNDVIALLQDPDVAPFANQPPLADLKMLAGGFRDLSVTAAAPPPVPTAPAVAPSAPIVIPVRPDPARIYGSADANVVPPVVVRQDLPPFPGTVSTSMQGALDVVIDETGAVVSATMKIRVGGMYDAHALAAARTWRYRPATLNGTPVKYRKTIQIAIKPTQ